MSDRVSAEDFLCMSIGHSASAAVRLLTGQPSGEPPRQPPGIALTFARKHCSPQAALT
jgi:hypothetical protein